LNLIPNNTRVYRFLVKTFSARVYQWHDIPDPRHRRGRRWAAPAMLRTLMLGLLAGVRSLLELEALSEDHFLSPLLNLPRRLPDTTLYQFIRKLDPKPLREKLVAQVRFHYRRKRFLPQGLPCGVLAIDGKCIGVLSHDAHGQAQPQSRNQPVRFLLRTLRAVLTSSPVRPCVDQYVVPAHTNDMGAFPAFFKALLDSYGSLDLFEIVTLDAGFCSLANATLIHQADRGYVIALRNNQPDLLAEARRVLTPLTHQTPDAVTVWEQSGNRQVRRRLHRTREMAGFLGWTHLRQVWVVIQESRDKNGNVEMKERYFVTNLPWGRLSPQQILQVVRGHWGIENDCNWSYDTQWLEDEMPWCRKGNALVVLGLLRCMAYNLINILRKRHLMKRSSNRNRQKPYPFQRLFRWVKEALARHQSLELTLVKMG